ncbi:MAG: hypothetical protein M1821_008235 [Bathelium mastoideum]|nr:MAG: hypothetical protein M1821_008235 [Bathelium mastoideum]
MFSRSITAITSHGCRAFSSSTTSRADFTHAVIGGGAVGLAIARRLQSKDGTSTVLLEKHGSVGTETSSRNSEVIHAGIYYGRDSLKTKLCVQGKDMMYDLCERYSIPYRNCGKWLVAQDDQQMGELEKVHTHAQSIDVPIHFVSREEAQRREPDVRAQAGVLESPTTGIIDSHAYMTFLQGAFEELGGDCAFHSAVTRIEPLDSGRGGWKIWITSGDQAESEADPITVETLINSAGLHAIAINNMIQPPSRHRTPYYAKGNYFSYARSSPKPSTLVYPAPRPGHGGLGTHLTLDLAGRIRFGPDVEWVDSPADYAPTVSPERFAAALAEIRSYLPGVDEEAMALDYAGIRPKLVGGTGSAVAGGKGFQDFYIKREEGFAGWVNLLGIESPGLTSSLAIGEMVYEMLYK